MAPPSRMPDRVGPYRVEAVLGAGGMGVVYRARAPDGTLVALKTLLSEQLQTLDRFQREAEIRIEHRNVIRVLDAGREEGTSYIAFELLQGEGLDRRIERGPLSPAELLPIARQACDGLAEVHRAGIIHRDLKPGNLFCCSDGTVKVLDFGIAQARWSGKLTAEGDVIGSIAYLSPEQARGQGDLDARTDVWAMGALMFEALTGVPPFVRASPVATLLAIIQDRPPLVQDLAPGTPTALAQVIARCLGKDRLSRFEDAVALGRALASLTVEPEERPQTRTLLDLPRPSIAAGEQRVVAVLLARGVRELADVERAVVAAGGEAVPFLGEGVVGLFGGRSWEGDEVSRAVHAAVRCRDAAERIAVGSGRARSIGSDISGAAVQAAERGCALGLRGVAVDPETARAVANDFVLSPARSDFSEVIRPAVQSSVMVPAESALPRLLGRASEMREVYTVLEKVFRESRAHVVRLAGPLGIGKSRLRLEIEMLITRSGDKVRLLSGRGEPSRRDAALSLFTSVLWKYLRRSARAAARDGETVAVQDALAGLTRDALAGAAASECAAFLGELLGGSDAESEALKEARADPELMADRLRVAVHDVVTGLARRGPMVVALDDLQWADSVSLELLDRIARSVASSPVLFLLCGREAPRDPGEQVGGLPGQVIELRGLAPDAAADLARRTAGGVVPDRIVEQVATRTEGNPLFVEQIALALRDRDVTTPEELAKLPIPVTVEAALQARLDQLPERARDLCKRASVLGRPFLVEEVEAVGAEEAASSIELLVHREILSPRGGGDELAFRSALMADVTYRMIAPEVRRELHRRAAEYLDGARGVDPVEAGHHWDCAGSPSNAARCHARAAVAAARRADSETVLRCSERALALGAPAASLHELHMVRADALRFLGRRDEQARHLEEALRYAATDAERARVLSEQVGWLSRAGRLDEAVARAAEAVAAARASHDEEALVRALCREAEALTFAASLDRADVSLREAAALARDTVPRIQAIVAGRQARVATVRGDVGSAADAYRQAVELYGQAGALRQAAATEMNLADCYNRIGAFAEAESSLTQALATCRRVGHRLNEGYALANLGYAQVMQGRPDAATRSLDGAAALARSTGDTRLALFVRSYVTRALIARGEAVAAALEAERLADDARQAGQSSVEVIALTLAAQARLLLQEPQPALVLSTRAIEIRDALGGVEEDEGELFLVHVDALSACGREDDAHRVRERARARIRQIADRIADFAWRRRFVEGVSAHRTLLADDR